MRYVVLDTETTGLSPLEGHGIIEIGAVEMEGRRLTGKTYHQYIRPEREVEAEAFAVHGISNEYLADKPQFSEIAEEFLEFIDGAHLLIHNAPFDVGFIDAELDRVGKSERVIDHCQVTDTLALARKKHPGQKNNLDALCRRYGIDNSHRELHGALLDSEILADVYLLLTGGQTNLILGQSTESGEYIEPGEIRRVEGADNLTVVTASAEEQSAHQHFLQTLDKKVDDDYCLWNKLDS